MKGGRRYRQARHALWSWWMQSRRDRVLWSIRVLTPAARLEYRGGPTIRQIAKHCGLSRGAVERTLLELSDMGIIEKRFSEPGGVVLRARVGQAGMG